MIDFCRSDTPGAWTRRFFQIALQKACLNHPARRIGELGGKKEPSALMLDYCQQISGRQRRDTDPTPPYIHGMTAALGTQNTARPGLPRKRESGALCKHG